MMDTVGRDKLFASRVAPKTADFLRHGILSKMSKSMTPPAYCQVHRELAPAGADRFSHSNCRELLIRRVGYCRLWGNERGK